MLEEVKKLREIARGEGQPVLRPQSYELLLQTVKKHKPKTVLEIGVNRGLSGISILLTEPDCKLTGIEIDEDCIRKAKENYIRFNVEDRVKVFCGDASEIIPILTGKYDFIFLDGPKGHYYEYLPNLISALNVGGVLFADNVLFRGYVDGSVKTPHRHNTIKNCMEKFLKAINEDETLKTQIYHIEDGISITEKLK